MIFHDLSERRWEALMQSNLAEVLCELQQPQAAVDLLDEALSVFRDLADHFGEGNALFLLSRAQRELDHTSRARSAIEQAMAIADDEENRLWQAHWLVELGKVQLADRQAAAATHRELEDSWSLAQSLTRLANALDRDDESPPQSRSAREEALMLLSGFDDPKSVALRDLITD